MSSGREAVPPTDDAARDELEAGAREHYEDAALYDFEYRRRRADVNHYRRLARDLAGGGPVLELGCGTGRVLTALARDGHEAFGVDRSQSMLLRAAWRAGRLPRRAAARVHLVRGDIRRPPLRARFPLIVSPFHTLQHLYTRADVEACLAGVKALLAPGGVFAFDVMNPSLAWLTRDPRRRWARTRFKHPVTEERWEYSTNQTYDPIAQVAHVRLYYAPLGDAAGPTRGRPTDGGRPGERVVRVTQRQFFPAELDGILAHAGLVVVGRWGDFDGAPLEGDSPSQVLACRVTVGRP